MTQNAKMYLDLEDKDPEVREPVVATGTSGLVVEKRSQACPANTAFYFSARAMSRSPVCTGHFWFVPQNRYACFPRAGVVSAAIPECISHVQIQCLLICSKEPRACLEHLLAFSAAVGVGEMIVISSSEL